MLLKKSLGQNFLKSESISREIVSSSNIKPEETVLEIGPGEGMLTKELLAVGARVVSVEKDDRLMEFLNDKFKNEIESGQLRIIHGDILETDVSELKDYKLVANIPYYITGEIFRLFLESKNQPKSMTLLVQKEVAERIVARDKKESLLSNSIKIYGEPSIVRRVGRGAFSPPPNVDSAVIKIENISKNKLKNIDEDLFFKILHLGFAHKRKQLLPNLSVEYPKEKIQRIFLDMGISDKVRAENLNIESWLGICSKIVK